MKAPRSFFLAGTLGLIALADSALAVVTITFAQDGSNVTATLSGSLQLPAIGDRLFDDLFSGASLNGSTNSLNAVLPGIALDVYGNGTSFASGLSQNPDSFSGPLTFGYGNSLISVDGSYAPGSTITPTGTWTWNNTTLASIGLGSLTTTPFVVYETAGGKSGDTIEFVAAVPEPSSAVLVGISLGVLLRRRRR